MSIRNVSDALFNVLGKKNICDEVSKISGVHWNEFKEMDEAKEDFEIALSDYIDERIDEKLKEKKNGNG